MQDPKDWNVIIVDDEPHNIGVVQLVLDFHEAKTRIASSGIECINLMRLEKPNMLLVDIQMPEMDGIALLELIRINADWQKIPAIAVTAKAMPGDRKMILEAGFNGYIPKPIAAMTFVEEVKDILNGAVH